MRISSAFAPLPNMTFELIEAERYYDQLLKALPKARKRIVLAAMDVLWGNKTKLLFAEIERALARGVRVHIMFDTYTRTGFGVKDKHDFRNRLTQTMKTFDRMRAAGARVDEVRKIGINPFKGRCHIKITLVDDVCFSFGGINFLDENFPKHDYMLYTRNAELADCLAQLVDRIARHNDKLPDGEVSLGNHGAILFDGGEPKRSIIYERAVALALRSENVTYVSQTAPSGELASVLQAVGATCYFNRPEQVMRMPARWALAFDQRRYRTVNSYHGPIYIHAKFMLFELIDGRKAAITGSNNFSWRGVAFGTQEIALYSTDTHLWQQLSHFINEHIKRA